MIFDDHSSIYVGGLPYDITDDSLRKVFYIYGAVLAVKIINDRSFGGKCYGFVTFANPRSAMQAINEMDGKTIDGRVVKVNEVRSRGGRPNLNHMSFQHDMKCSDGDRGRDRGRVGNYDKQRHQEEHWERSQEKGQNRERGHDRCVDEERFRGYSRRIDGTEQEHVRKLEGDCEKDIDMNIEQQRNNNHHKSGYKHKHQQLDLLNRSRFDDDDGSKELSLESFNDDEHQEENNLAVSNQKLEELCQEISQLEKLVADKQRVVSKLQEKYQKLEESLVSATKFTSRRQLQLAKLHKCYLHMRDSDEIFKRSEQELQLLINSTKTELGNVGGGAVDDVVNGRALT